MNPPSIILGGVHGKACWLIAYMNYYDITMLVSIYQDYYEYSQKYTAISSTLNTVHSIDKDCRLQAYTSG